MSTPDLDSILDSITIDTEKSIQEQADDFLDSHITTNDSGDEPELIEIVELEEGEIDPRLKLLSHSSRTTLHKCPRKYQLYRRSANTIDTDAIKELESGVTFAYGSAVGVGIASVFENKSEQQILLDTFLAWDVDLLDETPRQNKSFWLAMFAVQKMYLTRNNGFLDDYEIVEYDGKLATELSFLIQLPDGFAYRGFVDVVLRNKHTGEVVVVECKTSSSTAQSAMYKNSGQALGYSVVLDKLFPGLSSYTVLYLVYETKSYEYKELPFSKSLLQRALWLQELLIDTDRIKLYESYGHYPMHGESCYDFFRECEYLGLCTLQTANLTKPLTTKIVKEVEEEASKYDFVVSFYDLIETQIAKGE